MTAVLSIFFALVLIVGPIAAAVAYILQVMKQRAQIWHDVAEEFGLHVEPRGPFIRPSISGLINGIDIRVETVSNSSELSVTRYRVRYPRAEGAPSIELTPTRKGNFRFGARQGSITVGDPRFDNDVHVDAADVAATADYLTSERRQTVLHLFTRTGWSEQRITADSITVSTPVIDEEIDDVRSTLRTLVHAAHLMGEHPPPNAALPAYQPGPLDDVAISDPPEPEAVMPADARPPTTHEQAFGEQAFGEQVLDEQPVPEDHIGEAELPDQDNTELAEPTEVALDQSSVMHDLFDSTRMGFDNDQHFLATYDGAGIVWNGTVDTVRSFTSDRDFDGSGNKVTVLLGYLRGEELRSRQVKAVVQLDADTSVTSGDTVTVSGTLVRADRFTNSLYVANAEVW